MVVTHVQPVQGLLVLAVIVRMHRKRMGVMVAVVRPHQMVDVRLPLQLASIRTVSYPLHAQQILVCVRLE